MTRYVPLGDSAITVVLGEGISRPLSDEVLRVTDGLRSAAIEGVIEIVPAYASLGIFYDPRELDLDELLKKVKPLIERSRDVSSATGSQPQRTIRIPVRYDGDDLAEFAERTGHSAAEVIALHAGREYYVYVIGFVPGFAY